MSNNPQNINSAQKTLYTAGKFELGEVANVLPDHAVRRAGLKRYGRAILIGVGAPLAAVGLPLLAARGVQNMDEERQKSVPAVNANDQNSDGHPDQIPTGVTHKVAQDENPYTIAEPFNTSAKDTLDMANRIEQDQIQATGSRYVHKGDEVQITPPAPDPNK